MANCGAEHGKVCATVNQLEISDKDQWGVINELRDKYTKILTASIATLVVVVLNLLAMLFKFKA